MSLSRAVIAEDFILRGKKDFVARDRLCKPSLIQGNYVKLLYVSKRLKFRNLITIKKGMGGA